MITVAERLAACTAGMVSALYTLAALITWWRVAAKREEVNRILVDRAFAWSAFAVLFALLALAKLKWLRWTGVGMDAALIVANVVVFVAGLFSVRAITAGSGSGPLLVFIATSVVAAAAIWILG